MKKVLFLTTGGTIACQPTPDGLVPALDGAALVKMVPGLSSLCDITCQELFNLDSSNIEPEHWQILAGAIEKSYFDFDGFVIAHGTDTLAYTAAALSWMLQHLQKPVVLTGAQFPITMPNSDAQDNLRHAFAVAGGQVPGVMLVFGDKVLGGGQAKKLYTESRNAFVSVNAEPWADITTKGIIWRPRFLQQLQREQAVPQFGFKVLSKLEPKVALVKIIPGLDPGVLDYYISRGYKGLVLEGFGAGGVPNGEHNWLPYLEKAARAGIRILCASQCIYEGVNLHKYPIGTWAVKAGAKSAGLLTTEAAVTKLMWELANNK
jgi:L-asparaginase